MRKTNLLAFMLAVLLAAPVKPQSNTATPEVLLGAALHQERVTGNLQGAIEGYRKVLASKGVSRTLAAQAQYHIGVCYDKLGNREARKAFELVVRDYSDQKDLVAQARARLAAMGGAPGVRTRLLWDNATDLWGSASADGRYLSFTDWSTAGVDIRDLVTGENRRIKDTGGFARGQGQVWANSISPDGKRVAFGYYHNWSRTAVKRQDSELHVIGADGKGHRVLLSGKEIIYLEPYSWSPDGKWISAVVDYPSETKIALISPDGGQARFIPMPDHVWRTKVTFSPDGNWLAYTKRQPGAPTAPALCLTPANASSPSEVLLQENATLMGWTPDGAGLLFSRERIGVHDLYLLPLSQGKPSGEPRPVYVSSDVGSLPLGVTTQGSLLFGSENRRADASIFEWDGNASHLDKPVITFPTHEGVPMLLGGGVVSFSPDGKRLLGLAPRNGIRIRDLASGTERTITPQVKGMMRVEWAHDSASLLIGGIGLDGKTGLYRVDLSSGEASLLAGAELARFFVPSRDGKTVYYWIHQRGVFARDLSTGSDKVLFDRKDLGGRMLLRVSRDATKLAMCANQYLGIVDLASGQVRDLYASPENSGERIWALDWSADDRQLLTILRSSEGMEKMEMVIFPAGGGAPARQPISNQLRGLSLSPDGKYLGTTRLTQRHQVWALENFLPAK